MRKLVKILRIYLGERQIFKGNIISRYKKEDNANINKLVMVTTI